MFITFPIFNEFTDLVHAFSTRCGGVSRPPFDALNLGWYTPDDPNLLRKNQEIFFSALGIDPHRVAFARQIHSNYIKYIKQPGDAGECDALITDRPGLFLSVQTADCFPVFLYDPIHNCVGIIHSGWRGTAKNITGKTVHRMQELFQSQPDALRAAIGPGIQQTCYQVDRTTAMQFPKRFLLPDGDDNYLLDLRNAIRNQLLGCGLKKEHIFISPDCTHCRTDLFFSYRRDGQKSGRMLGIIGLR